MLAFVAVKSLVRVSARIILTATTTPPTLFDWIRSKIVHDPRNDSVTGNGEKPRRRVRAVFETHQQHRLKQDGVFRGLHTPYVSNLNSTAVAAAHSPSVISFSQAGSGTPLITRFENAQPSLPPRKIT